MKGRLFSGIVLFLATLGGLVFSGSAGASVLGPVIYQLQPGATGFTNKEYIAAYNNSGLPVEVTGWCLKYGASVSDTATLGCINPPDPQTKLWLASHGYLVAASSALAADYPGTAFDIILSSGSIASKDRYIRLVDAGGVEIDRLGWGTGTPEGSAAANTTSPNVLQRLNTDPFTLQDTDNNQADFSQSSAAPVLTSGVYEETVLVDVCPNLAGLQTEVPAGYLQDGTGNCVYDACQNIEGLQTAVPEDYERADGINCTLIPSPPPEDASLVITELLPNAGGVDEGKEFIELYNPNSRVVNLKNYELELVSDGDSYLLPDQMLAPGAYISFSDTQTRITLPNTIATLRLNAPAGNTVSTTNYKSPADDMAWAMVGGAWQYTNQPTPGSANLASLSGGSGSSAESETTSLEACPAGKFRNPETNRCKNIENEEGALKPCAADQTRNPETNRCRSIFATADGLTPCQPGQTRNPETNRCRGSATTASSSLTPCGPGQERNPATNRCRKIGAGSTALKPCAANQERNPQTNRCRKKSDSTLAGSAKDIEAVQASSRSGWLLAGGALTAAAGYGAWEWRAEMKNGFRRARQLFGKSLIND